METGGNPIFFQLIDNDARAEALDIVREAADADELLSAAREHFNESVMSVSAARVLEELDDTRLNPRLVETDGFDPVLFKAVVLFELSHLREDESIIPHLMEHLRYFWANANELDKDSLQRGITAETKRSDYVPFRAMSHQVIINCMSYSANEAKSSLLDADDTEGADPIKEEIDGKSKRLFIGGYELKFPEHHVLTSQLVRDLHRIFPAPIVRELEFRFPDEGAFEQIQPLIEKIQYERKEGLLPPAEELVSGYRRYQLKLQSMFGRTQNANGPDVEMQKALTHLQEFHRQLEARLITREVYVLELQTWFTIEMLESDVERKVYYRRMYYGDMAINDQPEVPLEARQPIIQELRREQHESSHHANPDYEETEFRDVFGSFPQ